MDEAEVEHSTVKDLIEQIQGMDPDDALYDAKVKVLGQYFDQHVEVEEEIFPRALEAGLDMEELGAQLRSPKEELMEPSLL